MWADALDAMMRAHRRQRARRQPHRGDLGIGAAARQRLSQRGSRVARWIDLDPAQPLAEQVAPMLSRPVAPIWMDSSTGAECAEIAARGRRPGQRSPTSTGSRAFERFTGPQIRKFAHRRARRLRGHRSRAPRQLVHGVAARGPACAARSWRRVGHEPDGSARQALVDPARGRDRAGAGGRSSPRSRRHGPSPARCRAYWQTRFGLSAAKVIAWSGDNPCSLIGVGLVREGRVAISLGTSDTIFGLMTEPRVDPSGTGHVFGVADRRLHGPHLLQQRIAGARTRAGLRSASRGPISRARSRPRRPATRARC